RLPAGLERRWREGGALKPDRARARALRPAADARLDLRRVETLAQDRIRERMRVFHNLMDQAREQEAYRQAQAIRRDLTDAGLPVPPAVTAGYQIGLSGYHLRELQELKRVREERFLAVLPPVHKPPLP